MLCMAGQEGEEKPRSMVTPTGYWYSDHGSSSTTPSHQNPSTIHQTHMVNHELQSFEPNSSEIYNLTSGMEMIGFPPKNLHHHHHHQQSDPSSSKNMTSEVPSSSDFYNQHGFTKPEFNTTSHETMMVLVDDDPSLRCVFPCEGNERPSQGLSLSLSSSNPSSIGLQSFELRHHQDDHRDIGFFGKSMNIQQQQQQEIMNHHHQQQGYFQIRNSKYLGPAQELLNEFCSLGTKKNDHYNNSLKVQKPQQDENASTSSKKQLLQSIDFLELQKRKTKLLQMLEEVDRRYKHYCDQMKAVVSSFEAVAGNGAATVYSCLASKAMSRHFRSLRDGIVGQIKETKKAMGEKDYVSPGTTKGETPRLRILDQTLRQQKAFQQISMMESHPWRPQRGLPERSVSVLRAWLFEHFLHPYPSDVDKHILARQTGLSRSQVSNWFINARVRLWKPMVEEMYIEETKEQENLGTPDACKALDHDMNSHDYPHIQIEDQKPNLVRIDSECISSIINHHSEKNDTNNSKCLQDHHHHQAHNFQPHLHQQAFGAIELDFSAGASGYHYGGAGGGSKNLGSGSGSGGGGVSLTLGLQQHGGHGMGLNFSQASQSTSLYYTTRDDIDQDCEQVNEYSLLESENQNLPYRNLMGAQLLHDLAG